ncbi:MAG TPA: tetratricopeptide repeat protein [Deltaproteobacteria bacterium]|nr:tetratricopeptide repeat protein [Candidatus Binatota bacterium]HIL13613.1 tetratricopeptide repeat protein [Deltaproteobacteria bacterium]
MTRAGSSARLTSATSLALVTLTLTALSFAAWGGSISGGFVSDDRNAIIFNQSVTGPLQPAQVFTTPSWWGDERSGSPGYRPLVTLSFAVNHAVGGLYPAGYHVVNILLHALVALLVYLLALELGMGVAAARIAGVAFVLLPIHSEAVVWTVGRAELMSAVAWCSGLLALLRYRRGTVPGGAGADSRWQPSQALPLLAAVALFAGLLCKENAITLLAVPPLCALFLAPEGRRRDIVAFVALLAAVGAWLYLRWQVLPLFDDRPGDLLDNPLSLLPLADRLAGALSVAGRYLWLSAWPAALSVDYSWNALEISEGFLADRYSLFALLALSAISLAVFRSPSDQRGRGLFLLLLAAAAYSVVSNTVLLIGTVMGERLFYLPTVALCLLPAPAVAGLLERHGRKAGLLVAAVGLAWLLRDNLRNPDWANEISLFEATAKTVPASARAHMELASAYGRAGRDREALAEFDRTLKIMPDYAAAWYNKGNMLARTGQLALAERSYLSALEAAPGLQHARVNLAIVYQSQGRWSLALERFNDALEKAPHDARLLLGRADMLLNMQLNEDAATAYTRLLELTGPLDVALVNRGVALQRQLGCAAAVGDYLAATRLTRSALSADASGINGVSPVMQNAWGNASFCLQELGRTDELRRLQQDWASITTPRH